MFFENKTKIFREFYIDFNCEILYNQRKWECGYEKNYKQKN